MVDWPIVSVIIALVAFNFPILAATWPLRGVANLTDKLGNALKEKDSAGDQTNATSYSRISGAVGVVMIGSLFWVTSNIAIAEAVLSPRNLTDILSSFGKLFLVGAALFLPYAFNQLKSVLQ